MKIAIITDGLAAGGAERQATLAAAEMMRRGHCVCLISYGPENVYADFIRENGIDFVQVTQRGRFRVARLRVLTRILRQGRFDVVHTFKGAPSIYGRLAAKLARVPCIYGGWRGQHRGDTVTRLIQRALSHRTAGWIVNSEAIKDILVRDWGQASESVFVVANGIEPARYRSSLSVEEARAKLGIPPGVRVVLSIARLTKVKNHPMLLRTAKRLLEAGRAVVFLVAGEGPLLGALESQTRAMGLDGKVRFLGRRDDVADLLRASDVLVLTSRSEGIPNAVLEAGAAGIPSVCTDYVGVRRVVLENRTGVIVAQDDDRAMAERIGQLLDDEELRRAMGRGANRHVTQAFSSGGMAERLLEVYRDGLARSRRPGRRNTMSDQGDYRRAALAIVGIYPPPYGGVGVSLQRIIPYLDRAGLDYVIYNTGTSRTNHPRIRDVGWSIWWTLWMLLRSRHRVVQFSTSRWWARVFGALLHICCGSKVIFYARGYSLPNSYFEGGRLRRRFVLWTLGHTGMVFATNPALADRIAETGFPRDRIETIPPFIPPADAPSVQDVPERVRAFCRGKGPILGANGGYITSNGQDLYGLHTMAQCVRDLLVKFPNLAIVVYIRVGADANRRAFADLFNELRKAPLRDHLLLYESTGEFCSFLKMCDLFLRPSITDGDSNSIREALYFGVPVVASDAIPRPEGCRVYRVGHQDELTACIVEVLGNLEKERERVRSLDHYNAATKLIDAYRCLVGEPEEGHPS